MSETTTFIEKLNINPRLKYFISEKVKELFINEYLQNQSVTASPLPSDIQLTISLKHDQSISYRPRRLSFSEKQKLREILDNLLKENIIRPSKSPYASPIVLVHKRNGELRFCIDYSSIR